MESEAKVIPMEESKKLGLFNTALTVFNITEKVLSEFKEAESLEYTDEKSGKVIRKHRQNAKSLRTSIESKRKEINRDHVAKTNDTAGLLISRIKASEDVFDEKIKVVEAEKAEKKAEADRVEKERVEKLDDLMGKLTVSVAAGLQYNLSSETIQISLEALQQIEISPVDYDDRFDEAEQMLAKGIVETGKALASRILFEDEQAAQEAEKKQLADEKAKFDADRVAEREKQAKADEKTRLANEKLKVDQETLENQKAEISAKEKADGEAKEKEETRLRSVEYFFENAFVSPNPESERVSFGCLGEKISIATQNTFKDRLDEYKNLLKNEMGSIVKKCEYRAHEENVLFDLAWDWAKEIDKDIKKEKLKADKVRAKLIVADKERMNIVADAIDGYVSKMGLPEFKTKEAETLVIKFFESLKVTINNFDKATQDLV